MSSFERLTGGGTFAAAELLGEADLGSLASDARPHVFFNFVTTLDGRANVARPALNRRSPSALLVR